jgi:hypothetical protein
MEYKSEMPLPFVLHFASRALKPLWIVLARLHSRKRLEAVGHYIEEAQGYLAQIRVLHQEALDEFSRAQGE